MIKTYLDYKNLKSEEIVDKLGILTIYTLNIYHTVNLMYRVKNNKHFGQEKSQRK